ncbi:MAG TPA: LacI family DNA-binding transcriptional regulator [Naasia sp.]
MTTMKDVADRAGVSISTVSRALSGRPGVGEDMRGVIRAAAESAGYVPNRLASNLRRRTTTVWGLLISDIQNSFFTGLVRAVEDTAHQAGYSLILCNSDEDLAKEAHYVDVLVGEQISGLLITAENEALTSVQRAIEAGIPVVSVDRRITSAKVDTVLVDNRQGARAAVDHLIDQGARRIAILNGSETFAAHKDRYAGYRQALEARGLAVDPRLVLHAGAHNQGAETALRELFTGADLPDALFIANNQLTIVALPVIADLGLAAPSDVLIACFDDLPLAKLVGSGLTVVEQPTYELGKRAAELLLERIADPAVPVREHMLSPRLIVRGSSIRA